MKTTWMKRTRSFSLASSGRLGTKAVAVWLANVLIVLPAIGEELAGSRRLTLAGMAWFAAAHTLFFVAQAILYARLRRRQRLVLS
jgi:hypothetical protein